MNIITLTTFLPLIGALVLVLYSVVAGREGFFRTRRPLPTAA